MPRPKAAAPRSQAALTALLLPLHRAQRRRAASAAPEDHPALQAIWHVVCTIPHGRVSTYGAVARAAGQPRRARQAGYALRVAPEKLHLPWHRVLGAGGRIAFPKSSPQHAEQTRRLRAEGINVRQGRVPRAALIDLEEL